jgi:hypothetical protein
MNITIDKDFDVPVFIFELHIRPRKSATEPDKRGSRKTLYELKRIRLSGHMTREDIRKTGFTINEHELRMLNPNGHAGEKSRCSRETGTLESLASRTDEIYGADLIVACLFRLDRRTSIDHGFQQLF